MASALVFSADLEARIEDVARRTHRSPSEVVVDALENGYSLEWQEEFVRRVEAGLAAAKAGDFATEADIKRVLNKYASADH